MVYRLPYRFSQHYAARIEWQPQPSWEFDGVEAILTYTGNTGTFSGDVDLYGTADWLAYTANTGSITFPKIVEGVSYSLAYSGQTGTVDAEPLVIATRSISATLEKYGISASVERYRISARLN